MVVLFIIMLAGIFLFFILQPPLQPDEEVEVVYESESSLDVNVPELAYIKRIDA